MILTADMYLEIYIAHQVCVNSNNILQVKFSTSLAKQPINKIIGLIQTYFFNLKNEKAKEILQIV